MQRLLLLSISTLLMLGVCGSSPKQTTSPLSLEAIYEKYSGEVVEILATPRLEGAVEQGIGTGFLVRVKGKQLDVLTARHVVDMDADYRIKLKDGTIISIQGITLGEHDVAFLDLVDRQWEPRYKGLELRNTKVPIAAPVFVIGSPDIFSYVPTQGNIGTYFTPKKDECPEGMEGKEFMMFTAPVWFGNSGGPIFDADGKVCGIVSWMFAQPRHFNFGVPSYVVKSELRKLTK